MARTAITIHGKNTILGIVRNIKAKADSLKERCVETFCYVGERCVTEARKAGEYNDITGNLRSSIGYVVLVNGRAYQYGKPKTYRGSQKVRKSRQSLSPDRFFSARLPSSAHAGKAKVAHRYQNARTPPRENPIFRAVPPFPRKSAILTRRD